MKPFAITSFILLTVIVTCNGVAFDPFYPYGYGFSPEGTPLINTGEKQNVELLDEVKQVKTTSKKKKQVDKNVSDKKKKVHFDTEEIENAEQKFVDAMEHAEKSVLHAAQVAEKSVLHAAEVAEHAVEHAIHDEVDTFFPPKQQPHHDLEQKTKNVSMMKKKPAFVRGKTKKAKHGKDDQWMDEAIKEAVTECMYGQIE